MSRFTLEAFVIRTIRMTESSRVVTLFSGELGKVKGVAKGVDRPKSKMAGAIALFNLIEADLYKKEGADMGTLGGASTLESFSHIAIEPRRFGFGSAWCEILDKTSHPDHPRPKTFDLTRDYFSLLNNADADKAGLLFWAALYKMLAFEGYSPEIKGCLSCGVLSPETGGAISLKKGGLVCRKCSANDDTAISVKASDLDLLRAMKSETLARFEELSVDKKTGKKTAEVILAFASYHLGLPRNLKSFKFLEELTD